MTAFPPSEFSLFPPGTNFPGHVTASYTNTISDRDDLFQEIVIAVWRAMPQFRQECSERTFVFRIAHNRSVTYLARSQSELSPVDEDLEIHDPSLNPESMLLQEQRAEYLRRTIRCLPLIYRQVIIMTLEGLAYEEIAAVLGISESNVGARLSRARQMLRETLETSK